MAREGDPPLFADVWQTKSFKSNDFGCVAKKGVTDEFFGCVANKGVVAQKCAIRAFLERTLRKRVEIKIEGGGYPIPGILQSVRKGLIAKELEETVAFNCEASVRK
jgi:hypothetical protein